MSSRSGSRALRTGGLLAALFSSAAFGAPKPDVASGKKLFHANCAGCHGELGDGQGPSAATLKTPPRNFIAGTWLKGTSADDLFNMMSAGLPASGMPPFQGMPESDRRSIAAYIKTLK